MIGVISHLIQVLISRNNGFLDIKLETLWAPPPLSLDEL